jgi:catechol 2,3-dioxygenase-like lactoylglutathione lyase family enzyme
MLKNKKIRLARPSSDLMATKKFYCEGLGFEVIASFEDHESFDGIMFGHASEPFHLEFARHHGGGIRPTPTDEDLLVFYVPEKNEFEQILERLKSCGYKPVKSFNPYWDLNGKTFADPDGYRVVIQNGSWQ